MFGGGDRASLTPGPSPAPGRGGSAGLAPGVAGGEEEDAVEAELVAGAFGEEEVGDMGRVERAAEEPEC